MRASSANQISIVSQSMPFSRATVSRRVARRLSVVARPGREFAVAHGPELPADCLLGDRDAEFLKYPLRQIDQPPAHHAVDRRDRTTFNHAGKCSAVAVVELGWLPRRLAVQ